MQASWFSSLYALVAASALYAAPLAGAAEQQSLETRVASEIKEIPGEYITDSSPRKLANGVKKIKELLKSAEERNLDLSKEYALKSSGDAFRSALNYATRDLVEDLFWAVGGLPGPSYRPEFTEPILTALKESEKAFGEHPYKYVLRGRQKTVVQLLAGKELLFKEERGLRFHHQEALKEVRRKTQGQGYAIPASYRELLNQPIEPWEHYDIYYTRLEDIPRDKQAYVPPEYRELHQKVAKR